MGSLFDAADKFPGAPGKIEMSHADQGGGGPGDGGGGSTMDKRLDAIEKKVEGLEKAVSDSATRVELAVKIGDTKFDERLKAYDARFDERIRSMKDAVDERQKASERVLDERLLSGLAGLKKESEHRDWKINTILTLVLGLLLAAVLVPAFKSMSGASPAPPPAVVTPAPPKALKP